MARKVISGLILARLTLIWSPKVFSWVLLLPDIVTNYTSYHWMQFQEKLKNQTCVNGKKSSFGSDFGPFGPNLSWFFFFFFFFFSKIWLRQSLDIMVRYHHVHYRKKQMIQPWENLVMSRQADRLRDESDFIGPCPTNVER